MPDSVDDFYDPEKSAILLFHRPTPEVIDQIISHISQLPVVPPSDPHANPRIVGSRVVKGNLAAVRAELETILDNDYRAYESELGEGWLIRYTVAPRVPDQCGLELSTIIRSSFARGSTIYVSEIERASDDVWVLFDNHTDSEGDD